MSIEHPRRSMPPSEDLHPVIYGAIVCLAFWMVIAAWGFIGAGYTDYALAIMTGFVLTVVGLPWLLWRVWRKSRHAATVERGGERLSFREWLLADLHVWQGRIKGFDAAVAVLLPVAAVAFGMTAFAIVLHFTRGGE